VTDQNGHITSYAYDKDNRRTQEFDDFGKTLQRTTTTTYDANGNQIAVTNPSGLTTSYVYDQLNRQTAVIDALGVTDHLKSRHR
jgi:YD repeat-containing protein